MIIDFHTHIFPDKIARKTIDFLAVKGGTEPYSDGSVSGLIGEMERAGADIAVTLPVLTSPAQFDSVNRFAKEVNERFSLEKRRLISFGGIHPDCEDIEGKMVFLKECGFLGVKIHPDYQQTFINDEKYIRVIKCASELDLIVVTHSGVDGGYRGEPVRCTPTLVKEVIKKAPHSKLVLAHLGANEMSEEVLDTLCGCDVYFDTAYILKNIEKERFIRTVEKHGEDRILFATDSPWSSIERDVKTLKAFGLKKETEEKILCENARALLGI